jgi:hypothetical protein
MKSRLFMCLGGLALVSSLAIAGPVTCASVLLAAPNGNFGALVALGSTGCDIDNVNYSNFNTTFTAANVYTSVNGASNAPFGAILGFTYNYSTGVFPTGSTGSIGYTATFDPTEGTACPVGYTCGIDGVETQLNALLVGPSNPSETEGSVVTTYSGGYVGTAEVDNLTLGDETDQFTIPIVVNPAYVMKSALYNGGGPVDTFSTEVITGSIVPEPATFGLLGGALLALGVFRKRFGR